MQTLETRLQEQQDITTVLQRKTPQMGTSGWQKTERPATSAPQPAPESSPTELYLKAFADYAAGRYQPAIEGFSAFVDSYPGNDYAGNAQYWLGECYYALQDYQQAVREFEKDRPRR